MSDTNKHILGLDLSTSCSGFTILDESGALIQIGHIAHNKKDSFYQKIEQTIDALNELKEKYNISQIFIEEPLDKVRKGKSSMHTIGLLIKFNGIVSWECHKIFDKEPIHIGATEARKALGVKLLSKKQAAKRNIQWKSQKEQSFDQISHRYKDILPEFEYKRTGRIKDYHYDEIDSFVVCLAGLQNKI